MLSLHRLFIIYVVLGNPLVHLALGRLFAVQNNMDENLSVALGTMASQAVSTSFAPGTVKNFVLPWELPPFTDVFGNGASSRLAPTVSLDDVRYFRDPRPAQAPETVDVRVLVQPAFQSVVRLQTFSKKRRSDDERRELTCRGFLEFLSRYIDCTALGHMISNSESYDEQLEVVTQTLAGKATSTLEARLRQIRKFEKTLFLQGWESAFPVSVHIFRVYVKSLLADQAPPSTFHTAVEIMNFSSGVLGLQVDDGAVDSPWVRGVLRGAKCDKKPVKRARALTVNELILLETYLIDGTDNHEDRYACGCFLFCIYARARWGDLVIVADFVNDTVSSGGQSYGYLEFDSLSQTATDPQQAPSCCTDLRCVGPALGSSLA